MKTPEQSGEDLRALTRHLVAVREKERTLIAREIHDELGQALTAIKLDLSWLRGRLARGAPKTPRAEILERLTDMSGLVEDTVKTVRRIAADLRPSVLDRLGLTAAIEWQAREFQTRTGIRCVLKAHLKDGALAPDVSTTVFRIFQETLTNVARHASAGLVMVYLARVRDDLALDVIDDGCGIPEGAIHDSRSLGLAGIRERAALVSGAVGIRRGPLCGTLVQVRIPLT